MSLQASHWMPIWSLGLLAAAFSVKHFLADFVLQTKWIALGKDRRDAWLQPLGAHVAIHAGLALLIILVVAPRLWWLALVDLAVHFAIDRASRYWGAGVNGAHRTPPIGGCSASTSCCTSSRISGWPWLSWCSERLRTGLSRQGARARSS
jgi:hypothetical protein